MPVKNNLRTPRRPRLRLSGVWLSLLLTTTICQAAEKVTASTAPINPKAVSGLTQIILKAQGTRMTKAGAERLTVQATLTDSKGSHKAQLIWEVPGRFRIDDDSGRSVVYDASPTSKLSASASDTDRDMLESLYYDSVDGFFSAITNGVAYQLVGRNYGSGSTQASPNRPPYIDSYAVWLPLGSARAGVVRNKLYVFDARKHTLFRTEYNTKNTSGTKRILTTFSGWTTVDGQFVPSKIERSENGSTTFSVVIKSSGVSAKAADGVFPTP